MAFYSFAFRIIDTPDAFVRNAVVRDVAVRNHRLKKGSPPTTHIVELRAGRIHITFRLVEFLFDISAKDLEDLYPAAFDVICESLGSQNIFQLFQKKVSKEHVMFNFDFILFAKFDKNFTNHFHFRTKHVDGLIYATNKILGEIDEPFAFIKWFFVALYFFVCESKDCYCAGLLLKEFFKQTTAHDYGIVLLPSQEFPAINHGERCLVV